MTRGSNRGSNAVVGGGGFTKPQPKRVLKPGRKAKNMDKKGKKSKKVKKESKESKKKSKQAKNTVDLRPAEQLTSKDFRRSEPGRESLRIMMTHIHEMDVQKFEIAPMFDEHCKCRLKVEGARNISWQQILESAPACVEAMYLAWI